MLDDTGEEVDIEVVAIEKISSGINGVNLDKIADLFHIDASEIRRPQGGEINMLIGMQYAAYHPIPHDIRGHLLLMKNRFGMLIAGSHPSVIEKLVLDCSFVQVKHAVVMHSVGTTERFFEIEGLGVTCRPRCGACRCGKCHPGGKDMSLQEEKEYEIIESKITFNPARGRWIAQYPWLRNPKELVNNRGMAIAVLKATEKKLRGNKEYAEMYSSQIKDMIDRKAARIVTEEELNKYKGPKYYLTHLAVLKPESKSTPCRIVFNSSARYKGLSLNECLMKGPSLLNLLPGILLRFRQGQFGFVGDIVKMYHSIDTPIEDQMTHLFLWRDCNTIVKPETFAITVVNMGDRPSSAIAQIALKKTAEEAAEQYPESSEIILHDSYMDDILGSTDNAEDANKRTNEISSILANRGFYIKEWISNYCSTSKENETGVDLQIYEKDKEQMCTEGALGMRWHVKEDTLKFKVSIPTNNSRRVTKRSILSVVNGFYDPLGLLTPFTVKCKIILRKLFAHEPKLGWDDDVPEEIESDWRNICKEIPQVSDLSFSRSLTPPGAVGNPKLVVLSDGAKSAFGAVAYARWEINNGFRCHLIAAKSRMAPLKVEDTVRLELCGSVVSVRIRSMIQKELRNLEFEETIHIVDSEIVHAMVHRESYGYNTFVGNRIGEIQRNSSPDEWMWVPGHLNVSDLTTRGASPVDIGEYSEWQQGPEFLKLPIEDWPVRRDVKKGVEVPELKKGIEKFVGVAEEKQETLATRINALHFSSWNKLKSTTARILLIYRRFKEGGNSNPNLLQEDLEHAERFWIKEAQMELDVNSKQLKKLRPKLVDEIIVVGGRTERWMEATWNRQFFVLLPKENHISLLIARSEHVSGGHLGRDSTISKIRAKYWIIGVKPLVKNIISKCRQCRVKLKLLEEQVMSPLPIERLKPSPPFFNVMIDYFGPFTISGEVQKRVRGKCYGVLFTCLSVRAVYIDVACDYSTQGFMMVLRRFSSIRGWPNVFYSDRGTQLVGASKELTDVISNLDWNKIKDSTRKDGKVSEWKFSPADAPWYNGAAEALIKSAKRALNAAIGENVLRFSEMQTCFFEASQLINQRPIGTHPSHPDNGVYLSPNDLLLGRATASVPQGPFQDRCSNQYRFDFVQRIVSAFWKRWSREVFPNLVIYPKWHTERRNVKKGDVVLMQDANCLRGKWKMAIVTSANPSGDGKVRHVTIKYKSSENIEIQVERPVQRLILLVPVDEEDN